MSTIQKKVEYDSDSKCYIFECPHCNLAIQVLEGEVNCQIFRHGTMKSTGVQINPHAPKEHCDRLVAAELIFGCAKPFKIFRGKDGVIEYAEACAYI